MIFPIVSGLLKELPHQYHERGQPAQRFRKLRRLSQGI